MPALLAIVNNGNDDQGSGGRWRAGEAVNCFDYWVFGWKEMPKTYFGQRTVAQVNAADTSNIAPYTVVEMLDGGTITDGHGLTGLGSIEVNAGDAIVLQFNETQRFWTGFGPRPQAEYTEKLSFIWLLNDKTPAEVQTYMEAFNKVITMTVVNGPDGEGRRRIEIVNAYVTASGDNSWDQQSITDFITEWNDRYPTCGLFEYQAFTADTVFVEGVFTTGQATEFQNVVIQYGLDELYARRRWRVTSAGMADLAANDGFKNTPASELSPVFRDGLLD